MELWIKNLRGQFILSWLVISGCIFFYPILLIILFANEQKLALVSCASLTQENLTQDIQLKEEKRATSWGMIFWGQKSV